MDTCFLNFLVNLRPSIDAATSNKWWLLTFYDRSIESFVICKLTMYDIYLLMPQLHKTIWPPTLGVWLLYSFQGAYHIKWNLDTDIDTLIPN